MKNEDILDIVRRCDLIEGEELVPGEAYLFNRKFRMQISGKTYYEQVEIIVLVKNGVKVGGIYRMGSHDIHCVIDDKYIGEHLMSNFSKKGIIEKIWPENKSVELVNVNTREEYNKRKYLASLSGLAIRNEEEIEKWLSYFGQ
jgi:hypothetical protein